MKALYIISICSILLFGGITSYSDIRFKKAYNKHLLVFLPLGIGIQVASLILNPELLVWTVVNIVTTACVSVMFYFQRIWAAGDAKLFTIMILLIPYQFYSFASKTIFPAFYCLSFVFTIAIVYILAESAIFSLRELKNNRLSFGKLKVSLSVSSIKKWLIMWLTAFLTADTFDQIVFQVGNRVIIDSSYLIVVINIFVSICVLTVIRKLKYRIVACSMLVIIRVLLSCLTGVVFNHLTFANVLVVIISMIIRNFANRYNYLAIATRDIKVGDILAQRSLVGMIPSAVKGLPQYTDETTKYRLNEIEVEAIKRWETSKYGSPTITIVRTLPFVPFITAGILFYIAFAVIWRV